MMIYYGKNSINRSLKLLVLLVLVVLLLESIPAQSGAGQIVPSNVNLPTEYSITFNENGLPLGSEWVVNVASSGVELHFSSNSTSLTFTEPNGTYQYLFVSNDSEYKPNSSTGSFIVDGKTNVSVSFMPATYSIAFLESGLPSGMPWSITFNDTVKNSTSNEITFTVVNGSYSYDIDTIPGFSPLVSSGIVTVNGKPITVNIEFSEVNYTVSFVRSGVWNGIEWGIEIAEQTSIHGSQALPPKSSNSSEISFSVPNGTYYFSVNWSLTPVTTLASPISGSFRVNGSDVTEMVNFTRAYLLYLNFTGPSNNTAIGYTMEPVPITSGSFYCYPTLSNNLLFVMLNGTYSFSIHASGGYLLYPSNGTITINGNNLQESITIYRLGYFAGTISPSSASLYINGTLYNTNNGQFNVSLRPGTYEVNISAPGYSTYTTNITVSSSTTTNLPIQNLAKIATFPTVLVIVIVAVAATIVGLIFVIQRRSRRSN